MKRNIFVIGIGSGNPDHMTIEATKALSQCSAVLLPDKGERKSALSELRREICARHVDPRNCRIMEFSVPERRKAESYRQEIQSWRADVADVYEEILLHQVDDGQTCALLVWGDPSLFDGTLQILEEIRRKGAVEPVIRVVPGITSIQALAASHAVTLNLIGQPVMITTGRRLRDGFPVNAGSAVVMLDAEAAFLEADGDLHIHWGAYVGMPQEILVSGKLGEVRDRIDKLRRQARDANGWIMDSYLLTRPADDSG